MSRKKNAVPIRNQDRRPNCLFRGDLIREDETSYKDPTLLQNRFVEFFPVVEVVEVDGVFAGAGVIGQAIGTED